MAKRNKDNASVRSTPSRTETSRPRFPRSSPITPAVSMRRSVGLSTRRQLQLALQFPLRDQLPADKGYSTGLMASASDLTRTMSYSKLLQRSPESFQSFRSSMCRPASKKPLRKPKVLKGLGVLKGIRTGLQRKQPRSQAVTPIRLPVKLLPCPYSDLLSSSDEDPSPWQMTSKYGPLRYRTISPAKPIASRVAFTKLQQFYQS